MPNTHTDVEDDEEDLGRSAVGKSRKTLSRSERDMRATKISSNTNGSRAEEVTPCGKLSEEPPKHKETIHFLDRLLAEKEQKRNKKKNRKRRKKKTESSQSVLDVQ